MKTSRMSKQFVANFNVVAKHYGLEGEELDTAKDCARRDPQGAEISFAIMADEIRRGAI